MVNLIIRMVSIEIVWRQCGKISLKFAWGFYGFFFRFSFYQTISKLTLP